MGNGYIGIPGCIFGLCMSLSQMPSLPFPSYGNHSRSSAPAVQAPPTSGPSAAATAADSAKSSKHKKNSHSEAAAEDQPPLQDEDQMDSWAPSVDNDGAPSDPPTPAPKKVAKAHKHPAFLTTIPTL
jgi:hypothetical protein